MRQMKYVDTWEFQREPLSLSLSLSLSLWELANNLASDIICEITKSRLPSFHLILFPLSFFLVLNDKSEEGRWIIATNNTTQPRTTLYATRNFTRQSTLNPWISTFSPCFSFPSQESLPTHLMSPHHHHHHHHFPPLPQTHHPKLKVSSSLPKTHHQ